MEISDKDVDLEGNDGVIVKSESKYDKNLYLAFNSNQIKSTSNRGTFSLEEDNIFHSQSKGGILGAYNPTTR